MTGTLVVEAISLDQELYFILLCTITHTMLFQYINT